MKPFDKAAAKRGATVCTRDGNPVRILCFNLKYDGYPIVAAIDRHAQDEGEFIETYTTDGKAIYGSIDHNDLMMADDKYLEKLERGEYDHIGEATEKVGHILTYRDVTPSVELITPFDESYWRRMYAGMAMQGLMAAHGTMKPSDMIAKSAIEYADALIEQLKKTQK